jgi:hypothetical protein
MPLAPVLEGAPPFAFCAKGGLSPPDTALFPLFGDAAYPQCLSVPHPSPASGGKGGLLRSDTSFPLLFSTLAVHPAPVGPLSFFFSFFFPSSVTSVFRSLWTLCYRPSSLFLSQLSTFNSRPHPEPDVWFFVPPLCFSTYQNSSFGIRYILIPLTPFISTKKLGFTLEYQLPPLLPPGFNLGVFSRT